MTQVVVLLPRTLKPRANGGGYMVGRDALVVDRALSRAGYRRWGVFNPVYGIGKVKRVRAFQKASGLVPDGLYGPETHRKLARHFDAYGASVMNDLAHRDNGASRAVANCLCTYNNRVLVRYTQGSLRMETVRARIKSFAAWFQAGRQLWEDCSGLQTGIDYVSGNPDPNGLRFNGYGYTGTQAVHGVYTERPSAGDCLGFYDVHRPHRWPYSHVVRVIAVKADGTVLIHSHGKDSDPSIYDSSQYRPADFAMWRRYPTAPR